jgi:hypothetical protein
VRTKLLIAAVLCGTLTLAACGGGGASTTAANSGPTKAQYLSRSAAICKATEKRLTPLVLQVAGAAGQVFAGSPGAATKVIPAVEQLHTIAAAGLAKLTALTQPAGDHALIAKFLTPLSSIVQSIATALGGLKKGQGTQALAQLQADQTLAQQVTSAAKKYGLRQSETIFSALG